MKQKIKYNWRYYKCKSSNGNYNHVIQNLKYTSLHIESNSKKRVFEKLKKFIKTEIKSNVTENYIFK